jgi:hypothetical protein
MFWRKTLPISFSYLATRGLLALLIAVAAVYAQHHVRVAGGLDSYGYVSTASLLASGRLHDPQPLVSLLPFESASTAAAPLGYVPGPDGRTSVPRFPIGLPLVMAPFLVFGASGPFFVPLLMAFATLGLAFLMGREANVPGSGLFAALLVAVDPLVVHYGIQPMSDVPASCWLIAALWLRLERPVEVSGGEARYSAWARPIAAGLCAGMALLTRPALLPAVIVLGFVTHGRRPRSLVFGAIVLIFVALQMAVNHALYGSARTSGYGPASYMFDLSYARLAANALNYGKWLTYSHSALIWFAWPAALVVLRRRVWAWQASAVAAAAAAPYLFYLVFDDWESSRFLLPTIILVLILSARALSVVLSHLPSRVALRQASLSRVALRPASLSHLVPLVLLAVALACAFASHRFLEREGVYRFGSLEGKYALAGEWFKTHTTDRAVVLAGLHSGSLRMYGGRETIRWDQMPSGTLAATIRNLTAAGYEPYLALDTPSEPPLFAERFRSEPDVKAEPIARVRVVNVYRFMSAR